MELTDKELIVEVWGDGFRELAGFDVEDDETGKVKPGRKHPRVHFFDDKIVVDLKQPVLTLDGETTSDLELRSPRTGDFRVMDGAKGSVAKSIEFLCALGNLMPKEADKISGRDFMVLQQVVAGFLSSGPATPGT